MAPSCVVLEIVVGLPPVRNLNTIRAATRYIAPLSTIRDVAVKFYQRSSTERLPIVESTYDEVFRY